MNVEYTWEMSLEIACEFVFENSCIDALHYSLVM